MTDVRAELGRLADEEYRAFHSRLLGGTEYILGVRVPDLWKLAKRLVKEEGDGYLRRASDETYEEIMLQGMVIALIRENFEDKLKRLSAYMAKIDNWAQCDVVCGRLKACGKYREETLRFLKPYLSSEKEFEVRFAVVLLMTYLVDEEHIDETLALLESVRHPGYYVKMGVAWAVSVCFVKFPGETMECLEKGNFDSDTYRKALQKIVESNRVDSETKKMIRELRRRPVPGGSGSGNSVAAAERRPDNEQSESDYNN